MAAQIFISYRRTGGDVTAKLICETLKNRGFSVFYDFDALKGGFFDTRILEAIDACTDVVLVLPPAALDRCINEDDWVRQEIRHAIKMKKNIVPVMLDGFNFPAVLPYDIDQIRRYNGIRFFMEYFDAVIDKIVERLSSAPQTSAYHEPVRQSVNNFKGTLTVKRPLQATGIVRNIKIFIDGVERGMVAAAGEVSFELSGGAHQVEFRIDWLKTATSIELSPNHSESVVEVCFKMSFTNSLVCHILK